MYVRAAAACGSGSGDPAYLAVFVISVSVFSKVVPDRKVWEDGVA